MKKNKIFSQSEALSNGYTLSQLEEMVKQGLLSTYVVEGIKYYRMKGKKHYRC